MNYDPAAVRLYQRSLRRESFRRDAAHQALIAPYLWGIKHGDLLMDFRQEMPQPALVGRLNHIFALWRTA